MEIAGTTYIVNIFLTETIERLCCFVLCCSRFYWFISPGL